MEVLLVMVAIHLLYYTIKIALKTERVLFMLDGRIVGEKQMI